MRRRSSVMVIAVVLSLLYPSLPPARADAALELYGTIHAMGVIVTLDSGDDPDQDAVANVAYRTSGGGTSFRQGFPLSRVSDTRFVGSLFWLEPGTTYDVRVIFSDPDGALDGLTLDASGATRAEIVIPAPENSFYVSPTGSGTACSLEAPCALLEGLDQAKPGDEVVLRGGVYYVGNFTLPRSGSPGAPIVIRGYPRETAVFDGADPATFTWTAQGGGVYRTTINVSGTNLVLANGERLYPYRSLSDLESLKWGLPGFYADGTTLYVHLAGDADPNGEAMTISRYYRAFKVTGDFIYFSDLIFRHYGTRSGGVGGRAIKFSDASDNLVQGCTFAMNDIGVVIGDGVHRIVIQDSEFYDTISEWPMAAVYDGSGVGAGGLRFEAPTTTRGAVIRRNTFHDYFDGCHVCPAGLDAVSNETDVYENLFYTLGDDGIEADELCSNVRVWGNMIRDSLVGISFAPAIPGPAYAIRNLIYRADGTPFKFTHHGGQSGPIYIFHNTSDAVLPDADGLAVGETGMWKLIHSRNNIWSGTARALEYRNVSQPISLDYDDLWNGNSGDLVRWGDTNYATLSDFTTATGQEAHGLSVLPGFTDAPGGDYTLEATSELIDAGVVIPGINDDYVGATPDIGAFEYEEYGFTLSVTPFSRAIAPGGIATYTIGVRPIGGFTGDVGLAAASPPPNLDLDLFPSVVVPPDQATLTITDRHTGTAVPGLWYTLPITATAGDIMRAGSVALLVGGVWVYLPLILR